MTTGRFNVLVLSLPRPPKYISQDLMESNEGFREQVEGNWILVTFKNPFPS